MAFNFDKLHGLTGTLSKKKERDLLRKVSYMQLDVELSKRVSHAQGLVYDKFDGFNEHSRAKMDFTKTVATGVIKSGNKKIEVESAEGFKVGQEVTVYDNKNSERKVLLNVQSTNDTENRELVDSTVVGSPFDTSSNGGRKTVLLKDGAIIAYLYNKTTLSHEVYKLPKGSSVWTVIASFPDTNYNNSPNFTSCVQTDGERIYLLNSTSFSATSNFGLKFYVIDSKGKVIQKLSETADIRIEYGQDNVSYTSMVINDEGTELHATWECVTSGYGSKRIRYAKGNINEDGSVVWGAVEQVTLNGNGNYTDLYIRPTLVLVGNKPIIYIQSLGGTVSTSTTDNVGIEMSSSNRSIIQLKRDNTLRSGSAFASNWSASTVFNSKATAQIQANPSAIFVPKEINGLEKGRIWVTWHGLDATDTAGNNIRVSYSDDEGLTWNSMRKLTSGNTASQTNPTITANKNNEVFITWSSTDSTGNYNDIMDIKYSNGLWGIPTKVSNSSLSKKLNPSSLFDLTMDFEKPVFIYQDTAKVGFQGKWVSGKVENSLEFSEPLQKSYAVKAGIARTNAEIKDGELVFGTWVGKGFVIKEVE